MKTMKKLFLGEIQTTFVDAENPEVRNIRSSRDASELIREIIGGDMRIKQMMIATFLNSANQVMFTEILSIGTDKMVILSTKEVVRKAIVSGCSAVVIGHNHTGSKNPSESDRRETKALKEGLKMFDIELLDHVILTADSYYSFADHGERSLA